MCNEQDGDTKTGYEHEDKKKRCGEVHQFLLIVRWQNEENESPAGACDNAEICRIIWGSVLVKWKSRGELRVEDGVVRKTGDKDTTKSVRWQAKFKTADDMHVTEDARVAEITIDLIRRVRIRMTEGKKVNESEIPSRRRMEFPEKIVDEIRIYFQLKFMGQEDVSDDPLWN